MIKKGFLKNKIVFIGISVQGPTYGIGHVRRSKDFLEAIKNNGGEVQECVLTQDTNFSTTFQILKKYSKSNKIIFLDLDPRFVKQEHIELKKFLTLNKNEKTRIVVFDSSSEFNVLETIGDSLVDLAIFPYGNLEIKYNEKKLSGFPLSIFSKEVVDAKYKRKKKSINQGDLKILISCGGSDPFNVTQIFISSLNKISSNIFEVDLILGKFASKYLVELVEKFRHCSSHTVRIHQEVESLGNYLIEADIALVTGGITRNECLFVGVPTIVIDLDAEQEKSSKLFENEGLLYRAGTIHQQNLNTMISRIRVSIEDFSSTSWDSIRNNLKRHNIFNLSAINIILNEVEKIWNKKLNH